MLLPPELESRQSAVERAYKHLLDAAPPGIGIKAKQREDG